MTALENRLICLVLLSSSLNFHRFRETTLRQNARTPRHKSTDVGYSLRQRQARVVTYPEQLSLGKHQQRE